MKKLLCLALTAILLVATAACGQTEVTSTTEPAAEETTAPVTTLTISEKIAACEVDAYGTMEKHSLKNIGDYRSEPNEKVYPLLELKSDIIFDRNGRVEDNVNVALRNLPMVNYSFPVRNLTKLREDLVYTTYLVTNNDITCTAYLFFSRAFVGEDLSMETWTVDGQIFFLSKVLQYADFSNIAVGSEIYDVIEVDPVAEFQWDKESKPEYSQPVGIMLPNGDIQQTLVNRSYYEFTTTHYLTDGVLKITYGRENVEDTPVVKEMTFKSGHFGPCRAKGTADYTIDPKDYPRQ